MPITGFSLRTVLGKSADSLYCSHPNEVSCCDGKQSVADNINSPKNFPNLDMFPAPKIPDRNKYCPKKNR
jgi:hypothetical protein